MQKFFIVPKVGIYAVNKTLMKSPWSFLLLGYACAFMAFCSTKKHTSISTIILHTKLSTVCPIEHFQMKLSLVPWNRSDQLLFYTELCPEGLAVEDLPKPLLCRETDPTSLPIMPMSALGYFQTLEITTSWFSSSSLPELLSTLPNPMLVWDIWGWRVRKEASLNSLFSKYVLFSLWTVSGVT